MSREIPLPNPGDTRIRRLGQGDLGAWEFNFMLRDGTFSVPYIQIKKINCSLTYSFNAIDALLCKIFDMTHFKPRTQQRGPNKLHLKHHGECPIISPAKQLYSHYGQRLFPPSTLNEKLSNIAHNFQLKFIGCGVAIYDAPDAKGNYGHIEFKFGHGRKIGRENHDSFPYEKMLVVNLHFKDDPVHNNADKTLHHLQHVIFGRIIIPQLHSTFRKANSITIDDACERSPQYFKSFPIQEKISQHKRAVENWVQIKQRQFTTICGKR